MRCNRIVVPLVSCLALGVVAVPTAGAQNASTSSIRLSGGTTSANVPLCGATRGVLQVGEGATAQAVVRGAKTKKGRRARKGTKIAVEKCSAGTWTRVSTLKLGARRKAKRVPISTAQDAIGDYRIAILNRRNRQKGGAAHLRVGVGEVVDTPVSFTVRNQNRTSLPCFPQQDNGTYTIKGNLVAPRSRLVNTPGQSRTAALYYHGFGYAEFFWRYKGQPGMDYGLEQARDGHASLTVDRLGYGQSPGPKDGNNICYSSQADIADQLIAKLRNGDYSTGEGGGGPSFEKVALVGHSAGAFISQIAQGQFQSADALGLIGFNNVFFTPLAGAHLTGSNAQCFTNPKPGAGGARNHAAFGESDADFTRGHIHNMDPKVAEDLLRMRTNDPCGDVLSIPPGFTFTQGAVRAINDPLLIAAGVNDAYFPPPGSKAQAQAIFSPFAAGVTRAEDIKDTGHAVTLGRTHGQFRGLMDSWLDTYGF